MELKQSDDAAMIMKKLIDATNEVVKLTQELILNGTEYNKARGVYNETKAKIKAQKEIISSLKEVLKAERY